MRKSLVIIKYVNLVSLFDFGNDLPKRSLTVCELVCRK